jgi:homoserine dehydrogenase
MTAPAAAQRPPEPLAPLRVALLGLGTVGRAVAQGLLAHRRRLTDATAGRGIRLVAVADTDPSRFEGLDLEGVDRLDDGGAVIGRPGVDVVVELIGGVGVARRLVVAALEAGHGVVTANKALLARHGVELESLARARGVPLRFEASVGGAIPVLSPLATDLAANEWTSVRGIVNGSTNFVLTQMTEGGAAYDDVIARARALGYLEADPSADVEGRDAADKLAILVRLAFGAWPDVTSIRRAPPALDGDGPPGITSVTARLMEVAAHNGLAIKLVARARRRADGRIEAWVLPAAMPRPLPGHLRPPASLAMTSDAENRIELTGEPIGRVAFVGPGAGGAATSSAILGDLVAVALGEGSTWGGLPPAETLEAGLLIDGLDEPRRWLTCDLPGEGGFTDRRTLDDLRRQLAGSGWSATLFPILDED